MSSSFLRKDWVKRCYETYLGTDLDKWADNWTTAFQFNLMQMLKLSTALLKVKNLQILLDPPMLIAKAVFYVYKAETKKQ